MARFRKVLLALDLESCSDNLIERVRQTCCDELDTLHVVHVIRKGMHEFADRDDSDAAHYPAAHSAQTRRELDKLTLRLRDLLLRHHIDLPSGNIHLLYGEPAAQIKRLARELQVDLLVVGSQNKGAEWLPLPGATTNCVLQGSTSDVMAIRV